LWPLKAVLPNSINQKRRGIFSLFFPGRFLPFPSMEITDVFLDFCCFCSLAVRSSSRSDVSCRWFCWRDCAARDYPRSSHSASLLFFVQFCYVRCAALGWTCLSQISVAKPGLTALRGFGCIMPPFSWPTSATVYTDRPKLWLRPVTHGRHCPLRAMPRCRPLSLRLRHSRSVVCQGRLFPPFLR